MIIALLCSAVLSIEEPPASTEEVQVPSKPAEQPQPQTAKPPEPPAPERTSHVSMRTSAAGGSTASFIFVEGGMAFEHRLGEVASIGIGLDFSFQAAPVTPMGVFGIVPNDTAGVSFEPMLRRWFGGATPLDGLFVGVSMPLLHSRTLKGPESFTWQAGGYLQLGYSLLLARGFVIQAGIGPGLTVSWMKFTTGTITGETIRVAAGLRSSLSFGYAF